MEVEYLTLIDQAALIAHDLAAFSDDALACELRELLQDFPHAAQLASEGAFGTGPLALEGVCDGMTPLELLSALIFVAREFVATMSAHQVIAPRLLS